MDARGSPLSGFETPATLPHENDTLALPEEPSRRWYPTDVNALGLWGVLAVIRRLMSMLMSMSMSKPAPASDGAASAMHSAMVPSRSGRTRAAAGSRGGGQRRLVELWLAERGAAGRGARVGKSRASQSGVKADVPLATFPPGT